MSWESDDCDCAEDWTCMRHRGELLTMQKPAPEGRTMTDEELKPLSDDDIERMQRAYNSTYSGVPLKWREYGHELLVEVRRLRAEIAALRAVRDTSVGPVVDVAEWAEEIRQLKAENARQAETIAKLRNAAQNLVDFWNTLTEEQTKLTPVEADELTELESQLREALEGVK